MKEDGLLGILQQQADPDSPHANANVTDVQKHSPLTSFHPALSRLSVPPKI